MIDRISDKIRIKAIGIIGNLDERMINGLYKGNIPKKLLNNLKAAGLNPDNSFEMEILMQSARLRLDDILRYNSVEFNGVYFERKSLRSWHGKRLYSCNDSIKRVNSFGARHAYPSELFSLLIARLEGKLNFEQKIVADDIMEGYGEWLYPEIERKENQLIVYSEGSANMEFDVKGIPSREFVDLCRFPEEFIIKMYSRRFEDLPEKMKVGSNRAQVYLPLSDGVRWPVGRGNYSRRFDIATYYYYDWASRWVASRENFFMGNGGKH